MELLDIALRVGGLVLGLGSIAWSIAVWRMGASKAVTEKLSARIDACEAKMTADANAGQVSRAQIGERLVVIEAAFSQVPDKDSVHKLALDVSEIRGDMKAMGESLKGVAATGRRVEEFLLDAAKVK